MEQVGLKDSFTALKNAREQLISLSDARRRKNQPDTTLTQQHDEMRHRLEVALVVADANCSDAVAGYESLADPPNELITEVMSRYRARMTRAKNRSESEGE
jgi:ATP-dependent protease HslVU (ClpYQ) peptidase subunit